MSIFLLSRKENVHADFIERNLHGKGVETARINVDDINTSPPRLTIRLDNNGELELRLDGNRIDVGEIEGVFVHHPRIEFSKELGLDDLDRKITASSWSNGVVGLEEVLNTSRWVNSPSASRESVRVLHQLRVARSVGMRVPGTCFSNDIEQVREFAGNNKRVVVKPGPLAGVYLEGQRILTRVVDVNLLTEEDLKYSPCFFQEYIEKMYELRVHVVGEKVLACRIDSQASEQTKVDWRNYDIAHTPHSIYKMEPETAEKCITITKQLGLELGIMDLIVTPEGEPVFLECNSNGYLIWIEELTGLPITDTVAEHLLRR